MADIRMAGGFGKPEVDVRAATAKAVDAELARLPARTKQLLGLNDANAVVDEVMAGQGARRDELQDVIKVGHPDFTPETDQERMLQEHMLQGYTSEGWTPDQMRALGRDPQPMEYSPGAKMLADTNARVRLLFGDRGGNPHTPGLLNNHELAARAYEQSVNATHEPMGWRHLQSPETTIGYYMTKMGPVMSDGWSQLATALLSEDGNIGESAGNAAVRSYGADWNRVSPQLKEFTDWRTAHNQIRDMRNAYADSEGMDSADTLRATAGIKPSWYTRPVEWAMSLGNGLLDGSFGGGSKKALLGELIEESATDGAINTGIMLATPPEYRQAKENESAADFAERQKQDAARRNQAIRQLESGNDQIVRPESPMFKSARQGAVSGAKSMVGSILGGLF